jgi:hypothetical protein
MWKCFQASFRLSFLMTMWVLSYMWKVKVRRLHNGY